MNQWGLSIWSGSFCYLLYRLQCELASSRHSRYLKTRVVRPCRMCLVVRRPCHANPRIRSAFSAPAFKVDSYVRQIEGNSVLNILRRSIQVPARGLVNLKMAVKLPISVANQGHPALRAPLTNVPKPDTGLLCDATKPPCADNSTKRDERCHLRVPTRSMHC